jgi:hypothetical protein
MELPLEIWATIHDEFLTAKERARLRTTIRLKDVCEAPTDRLEHEIGQRFDLLRPAFVRQLANILHQRIECSQELTFKMNNSEKLHHDIWLAAAIPDYSERLLTWILRYWQSQLTHRLYEVQLKTSSYDEHVLSVALFDSSPITRHVLTMGELTDHPYPMVAFKKKRLFK